MKLDRSALIEVVKHTPLVSIDYYEKFGGARRLKGLKVTGNSHVTFLSACLNFMYSIYNILLNFILIIGIIFPFSLYFHNIYIS